MPNHDVLRKTRDKFISKLKGRSRKIIDLRFYHLETNLRLPKLLFKMFSQSLVNFSRYCLICFARDKLKGVDNSAKSS